MHPPCKENPMDARQAIRLAIDFGNTVSMAYLEDLSDSELFHRPCPGANHINWQLGHLIVSEHQLISRAISGAMPALPDGFAGRYTAETASLDKPDAFCTKQELLEAARQQRMATLAALEKLNDSDLDRPSGIDFAPTVAAVFSLQGSHWLMHAGQWAVIRRQLGRPPLF
jgi:hypothetical protein